MSVSFRFPGGRSRTLTFSYDDGSKEDRRLVDILTKHGMKGTFNLNYRTDPQNAVAPEEYKSLYIDNGHEIACHALTHPFLDKIPPEDFINEIRENRLRIEERIQRPVKGMAYPGAYFCPSYLKSMVKSLGILYARTAAENRRADFLPDDWLEWHPTSHHNNGISALADAFLAPFWFKDAPRMLYIWGHSFEFENGGTWQVMEDFCKKLEHHEDIWYATNYEIYQYVSAFRRLEFSADCSIVYNPSACSVWVCKDGAIVEVRAGETVNLNLK